MSQPQPIELTISQRFAAELLQTGFKGDILLDDASRTVYATDNSIYQVFPLGVLCPKSTRDVVLIAELSQQPVFRELSFCARGGGTSTNGQSLNAGFTVDFSKHMNQILEINVEQRWARVQAGVIKDQLNAAVRDYDLFFAPDLSTSNRATIGGMINTDASGQGSCVYGKTRNHVLSLRSVLIDGSEWVSTSISDETLAAVCQRQDKIGEAHRIANNIEKEFRPLIEKYFPTLNRSLTGYDLAHLRNHDLQFDLNSLLCGSEGSLAFVTEAVVNLEPIPKHQALVIVRYNDFIAALEDARHLMSYSPTAIETVDGTVLALAKSDSSWLRLQAFFPAQEMSQLQGVNIVEITGEDAQHVEICAQKICASYADTSEAKEASNANNCEVLGRIKISDAKDIAAVWAMRKRAVGLLGNMQGEARPVPFVEDVAVPPQQLAAFIKRFRQLLDEHELKYGMFGHVDAGVIHVRPALDMRDESSIKVVRHITDEVVKLTREYGGVLWGEHGKGVRAEFSPEYFGELYPQLQRIKAAFDPHNQLNPGKIATPSSAHALLKIDEVDTRGNHDRLIANDLWNQYRDAVHCNGNGACFDWNPDNHMCPSWKVSQDRRQSPKGRASLMREWLKRESVASSLSSRRSDGYADQVREAMDTCLACKACVSQCPIHVDVPEFRSAFYQHYYQSTRRPLRHYLIHYLERLLPFITKTPGLSLLYKLTETRILQAGIAKLTGLTALPKLSSVALQRYSKSIGVPMATADVLRQLTDAQKQRSVILVQDVFTSSFEVEVIVDSLRLLQALGFYPLLAPFYRNGKPSHVLGFLKEFRETVTHTTEQLTRLTDTGIPLVGLEPSMTLCYRSEYKKFLGQHSLPTVHLVQEWLADQQEVLRQNHLRFEPGRFRFFPHCTEASNAPHSVQNWKQIFQALGQDLSIEQVGCCGMAGTYGHEVINQVSSQSLFEMSWSPALKRVVKPSTAVASGFSCRQQSARFGSQTLLHPLQALLHQMRK